MEVPLADILGQRIVDVDFEPADHGSRIRGGTHHALVENRGGMDLPARPGPGLPCPGTAWRARPADDAIANCPLARSDSPVDAGALHTEHRVDSAEPLQCDVVPGVAV